MTPPYDLYSRSADEHCRFALGRSGTSNLLVIGLNPSTATRHRSDTTIAKVERVAERFGFDGFVMLNLCPIRATHFEDLPRVAERRRTRHNIRVIESFVERERRPVLWAAWGASIHVRTFLVATALQLIVRLRRLEPDWRHFGPLTARGHPRHPSRLNYDWKFARFDADGYAESNATPSTQV